MREKKGAEFKELREGWKIIEIYWVVLRKTVITMAADIKQEKSITERQSP